MPLYDYHCDSCAEWHRAMRPMAECKEPDPCPHCGQPAGRRILPPTVWGDIPDYISPASGQLVSGRRQRLNDLRKEGCIPYDPGMKSDAVRRAKDQQVKAEAHLDHAVESTYAELQLSGKV